MTQAQAERMVRNYTAGGDPETVRKIAEHMIASGDCVWHAAAVVTGKECWCADCAPNLRPAGRTG